MFSPTTMEKVGAELQAERRKEAEIARLTKDKEVRTGGKVKTIFLIGSAIVIAAILSQVTIL